MHFALVSEKRTNTDYFLPTHKFINPGLDLVAFVQGTILLDSPDIVSLYGVDFLRKFHPLILRSSHLLLPMELTNVTSL